MTLTVLASVSLLALVSTARPIAKSENQDADASVSVQNAVVTNAVQALLASHSGTNDARLNFDDQDQDIQVHITSTEELQSYLSGLDADAVRALVPLKQDQDDLRTADEQQLHDILLRIEMEKGRGRETPVPDDMLDSFVGRPEADSVHVIIGDDATEVEQSGQLVEPGASVQSLDEDVSSRSLIIAVMSCSIALLIVGCLGIVLYIIEVFRSQSQSLPSSWYLLSKLELGSTYTASSPPPGSGSLSVPSVYVRRGKVQLPPGMDSVRRSGAVHAGLTADNEGAQEELSEKPLIIFDDIPDLESVYDSADEEFLDEKSFEMEPMSVYATPMLDTSPLPPFDDDGHNLFVQKVEVPDPELLLFPSFSRKTGTTLTPSAVGEPHNVPVWAALANDSLESPTTPTQKSVFSSMSPSKSERASAAVEESRTIPAWAALATFETQKHAYPTSLSSGFSPMSPTSESKLRSRSSATGRLSPRSKSRSPSRSTSPAPPSPSSSSENENEKSPEMETDVKPTPRRAFGAFPEMDAVALAMQLRPILGLDPEWLVRFVVAFFGWCAVLVSGGSRE